MYSNFCIYFPSKTKLTFRKNYYVFFNDQLKNCNVLQSINEKDSVQLTVNSKIFKNPLYTIKKNISPSLKYKTIKI